MQINFTKFAGMQILQMGISQSGDPTEENTARDADSQSGCPLDKDITKQE